MLTTPDIVTTCDEDTIGREFAFRLQDSEPEVQPNTRTASNKIISKTIYRNLNTNTDEIRLLTLHLAQTTKLTLSCTLSHAALTPLTRSGIPGYEALSYVWGQPDLSKKILLNNWDFWITPILEYILLNLRRRDRTRVLWVDALCINQWDVRERNFQVALMLEVYSHCRQDIAWVGSQPWLEPQIRQGMELMHRITQKDKRRPRHFEPRWRTN